MTYINVSLLSKGRFCSATFVNEKDLPQGQKLLCCSRCREAFYVSREAQLEHWRRAHKFSCCSIENDSSLEEVEEIVTSQGRRGDPVLALLNEIGTILENPKQLVKGRKLLYLIQQLKNILLLQPPILDDIKRHQLHWGAYIRRFSSMLIQFLDPVDVKILWAIPSFTNYFLNADDVVLTDALKELKDQGLPPPAPLQSEQVLIKYDDKYVTPGVYGALVHHILKTGFWIVRNKLVDPILEAATIRAVMQLWSSPYVNVGFLRQGSYCVSEAEAQSLDVIPMAMRSVTNMTAWMCCHPRLLNENCAEVVPGMTAKAMLRTLLKDYALFQTFVDMEEDNLCARDFLEEVVLVRDLQALRECRAGWKQLTIDDRLDLLDTSHDDDCCSIDFTSPKGENYNSKECIIRLITGAGDPGTLLQMYSRVHTTSSRADPRTIELLSVRRDQLLVPDRPRVSTCVETLMDAQTFSTSIECIRPTIPSEVMDIIVEFSLGGPGRSSPVTVDEDEQEEDGDDHSTVSSSATLYYENSPAAISFAVNSLLSEEMTDLSTFGLFCHEVQSVCEVPPLSSLN